MLAILSHFLRYACWAVVGAALVYLILYLWVLSEENNPAIIFSPAAALLPIIGGMAVVVCRAAVGIISGYSPGDADRLTVHGLGRFLFGWILGRLALSVYLSTVTWSLELFWSLESGWLEIAFRLAGALAMVATGWLAFRRHGRFLLPIAWLAVFAILIFGWFSVHEQVPHLLKRLLR